MKYPKGFYIVVQQKDIYDYPHGDIEITFNGETITKDTEPAICIFDNVPEGKYIVNVFQKDWGVTEELTGVGEDWKGTHLIPLFKDSYLELSTDKTELKKGETCIIEAKASEDLQGLIHGNQIAFNINDNQRVIADYDPDINTAVMTYVATGAGKVQITAHAKYAKAIKTIYSNVLFLHDGVEK